MNVLVIGGSGLLGTHAVQEALRRGHTVSALARTPRASTPEVRWHVGDVRAMSDTQLRDVFSGQHAAVYALGLDDREPHARPAYQAFFDDHVTVCTRVMRAARDAGVRKFVVYGSYFTHFDRTLPELALAAHHPYVRSRCAQRDQALALAAPGFDVYVLELPYIIGSLPRNVPPWTFLFSMLSGPVALFFSRGGTAAVTAHQVAQASWGCVERDVPSGAFALGGVNWSWRTWAQQFFAAAGFSKRVFPLPRVLFVFFGVLSGLFLALRGRERGLAVGPFAKLQYADAFVDPQPAQQALGYPHDDYEGAMKALVSEWLALRR